MATTYQIKFTHATSYQNFPIPMKAFEDFPISTTFNSNHLDLDIFAFTLDTHAKDDSVSMFHDKFRLIVKLFIDYRLDLDEFNLNSVNPDSESQLFPHSPVINFDNSEYMNSPLDSIQKELLEHLDDLARDRLKTAIPNLVNWMDAYVGKNTSGYCVLRNAYLHPDLNEDTKKLLNEKFGDRVVFNPNGSIDRDANIALLQDSITSILIEVKNAFQKLYFDSESLSHKMLLHD